MISQFSPLLLALVPLALAAPAPEPVHAAHPMITARAELSDSPTPVKRGIISDIDSKASSYINSIESDVDGFLVGLPTGTAVLSSLGIDNSDLAATPTSVLNIPGYANWTDEGWNLRFHGNVYKQPNISQSKLDDLANVFLVNVSISDLDTQMQDQARNVTAEIFVVQQGNVNVSFSLEPASSAGGDGESDGGGATTAAGGAQNITYPGETTVEGDFDAFITLANVSGSGGYLSPGNETTEIQRLNVYTNGSDIGNATAYLVPTTGLTIISDIDDILRVTKIYEPSQGLYNSFAKAFTPWENMPDLYANWSKSIPNFHFHYLTTTPEQITRNYMDFIYNNYPGGSFDTRPLNFSDVSATLSIRKFLLDKVFQTFPERKFILIADTSNSDVMRDYPQMVTDYPDQVQCIWIRNTSATDSGDEFPYDTSGFQGLKNTSYMFFLNADDLTNLDIENGECLNQTIQQNVTFDWQGLPFGLSSGADLRVRGPKAAIVAAFVVLATIFVAL